MANEFSTLGYREQVSVDHLVRSPQNHRDIHAEVRSRALHKLLDLCLEERAHFYTPRVVERSVWVDEYGNPCPDSIALFRDFRFQVIVEKGSADLR